MSSEIRVNVKEFWMKRFEVFHEWAQKQEEADNSNLAIAPIGLDLDKHCVFKGQASYP